MKRLLIKITNLLAILLGGVAFSTSCSSSSDTTLINQEVDINTTKEALKFLNENRNYTFSYEGDLLRNHQYIFNENYIGRYVDSSESLTYFYCSNSGGTFKVEFSDLYGRYITSEYRSNNNVWDTNLIPHYYQKFSDYIETIEDDVDELRIKNTDFKRTFIMMMGYEGDSFIDIDSLLAQYDNDSESLVFTITIKSKTYIYRVNNFNKTTFDVENLLPTGIFKPYVPTYDEQLTKTLMSANNYFQGIYQYSETGNGYVGNNVFNPHYFATVYYGSTTLTGYISLHAEEVTEGSNAHPALNGTYFVSVQNYNSSNASPSINSRPISDNNDVTEVMNYPNHLLLLDNFHRFVSWNGTEDEQVLGAGIYTEDQEILFDFSKNFALDTAFEGQKPDSLGIDININGTDDDSIIFYYYFYYDTAKYVYPIPFFGFGDANIPVLDAIYQTYHTIED